jgi:prophage antirepressor-like protein
MKHTKHHRRCDMSNVINFNFNQQPVRIVEREDGPWFVGRDVLPVLGLDLNGTSKHYRKLHTSEKSNVNRIALGLNPGRPMTIVSESGLYKLVMRSDKPEARSFQDWVTRDVLPSIRKDGGYIMDEEKLKTGEMDEDEFIARVLQMIHSKLEKAQAELGEARPKAHRYDQLMDAEGTLTTTTVAKSLGTTATKLNKFLREQGIKFKHEDQPIDKYLKKNWFEVLVYYTETGRAVPNTRITPEGASAIVELYEQKARSA